MGIEVQKMQSQHRSILTGLGQPPSHMYRRKIDTHFLITFIRKMPSKQEAEQFKCTVCDKGFYLKSSVSAHMELVHGNNPFKCSICNKGIIF